MTSLTIQARLTHGVLDFLLVDDGKTVFYVADSTTVKRKHDPDGPIPDSHHLLVEAVWAHLTREVKP